MSEHRPTDMRHWTPAQHIDEACDLLQAQQQGTSAHESIYHITPIPLTQAQTHVDIAQAKMMGRLRA